MKIAPCAIKYISQLANNDDSIAPMATKDTLSNIAIVATYAKEGGKDDARERFIEEFGTGAAWLFAIPAIKKIFDNTLYKVLDLKSNLDCRNLTPDFIEKAKNAENIPQNEKEIFSSLSKNQILKYKGAFLLKFAISTAVSALMLVGIIRYKQKKTTERIEKDIKSCTASELFVNNSLSKENLANTFTSRLKDNTNTKKEQDKNDKNINFKGISAFASDFMYNPIKNTSILDGVITLTRIKEARKGEKREVLLKEIFQIAFIYCLAKPIQAFFEYVAEAFNRPIQLDPELLFDKDLSKNIETSKETVKTLLESVENMSKKDSYKSLKEAIYNLDIKKDKALLELLEKNKTINLARENGEIKGISYFNHINGKDVKKSLSGFDKISKNLDNLNGILGIKNCKIAAVIANVMFAALIMGILQPKLNIFMRKFFNNGDNRNPAIVKVEEEMKRRKKESNLQQVA